MASQTSSHDRIYSRSYLTKMKVAEAMDRLCHQRPFGKIRIEDIVRESGVSRSNFYHNFEDKNAVVNWLSLQCHENGIFRIGRDLTWFEGHLITTRDMARFSCLFREAGASDDYDAAVPSFVRRRQQNLRETIIEFQRKPLTDQLEFEILAFPTCEVAMASRFRNGELPYTLKQFCEHLVAMTPRELYAALEHPVSHVDAGVVLEEEHRD